MGKKAKKNKKKSNWTPPKGALAYFNPSLDDEFKAEHPIGYFFLVLLGIAALLMPVIIFMYYYIVYVMPVTDSPAWMILGWIGSFIIGIGFFNFVGIIIKQYLGHLVSILSFLLGGIMVALSLWLM